MGVSPMLVISSGRGLTAERGDNGVDIVLALSKKKPSIHNKWYRVGLGVHWRSQDF